jgi:hypothetical protein
MSLAAISVLTGATVLVIWRLVRKPLLALVQSVTTAGTLGLAARYLVPWPVIGRHVSRLCQLVVRTIQQSVATAAGFLSDTARHLPKDQVFQVVVTVMLTTITCYIISIAFEYARPAFLRACSRPLRESKKPSTPDLIVNAASLAQFTEVLQTIANLQLAQSRQPLVATARAQECPTPASSAQCAQRTFSVITSTCLCGAVHGSGTKSEPLGPTVNNASVDAPPGDLMTDGVAVNESTTAPPTPDANHTIAAPTMIPSTGAKRPAASIDQNALARPDISKEEHAVRLAIAHWYKPPVMPPNLESMTHADLKAAIQAAEQATLPPPQLIPVEVALAKKDLGALMRLWDEARQPPISRHANAYQFMGTITTPQSQLPRRDIATLANMQRRIGLINRAKQEGKTLTWCPNCQRLFPGENHKCLDVAAFGKPGSLHKDKVVATSSGGKLTVAKTKVTDPVQVAKYRKEYDSIAHKQELARAAGFAEPTANMVSIMLPFREAGSAPSLPFPTDNLRAFTNTDSTFSIETISDY